MSKSVITNNEALAKVTVNQAAVAWFKPWLDKWPTQWAGPKPTLAMFMVAGLIDGKRPGVEAGHIAMCLRDGGCTVQQFTTAFSCGPANNYRRALVGSGFLSCTVEGKPYAFKLTFTAKGMARLEKGIAAAALAATAGDMPAKPAKKAAGKRKAKKAADTAPAQTPTSEQPSAPEGQTAETAGDVPVSAGTLADLAAHFQG